MKDYLRSGLLKNDRTRRRVKYKRRHKMQLGIERLEERIAPQLLGGGILMSADHEVTATQATQATHATQATQATHATQAAYA